MDEQGKSPIPSFSDRRGFRFGLYCTIAAFGTYFCMYAFRKPFAAGTYDGLSFGGINFKILLIISQVAGYTLSKFIGIKVISEMSKSNRIFMLLVLIGIAEFALVGLGVVPYPYNFICMFLNGLPLGMIWGIVFSYLEGRQSTEALAAGLSASFIVSSGVVKAVGKYTMSSWGVAEFWMPAVTGSLFVLPLLVFVALLSKIPRPDHDDIRARTERIPMTRSDRWSMLRNYWFGLALLIIAHMLLTGLRDFRDKFSVEILATMGMDDAQHLATSELPVMLLTLIPLGCIMLIRNHRTAYAITMAVLIVGFLIAGLSTLAWEHQFIGGFTWFICVGIGLYLAYVPYHSMLFESFVAVFREKGNAGYLIYVADATGYLSSVSVLLFKNFSAGALSPLQFFVKLTYVSAILGIGAVSMAIVYFLLRRVSVIPPHRASSNTRLALDSQAEYMKVSS